MVISKVEVRKHLKRLYFFIAGFFFQQEQREAEVNLKLVFREQM